MAAALHGTRRVLLDFDGPVSAVFAGFPAAEVASQLLRRLAASGAAVRESWRAQPDPFSLLHQIAEDAPALIADADTALVELETEAVRLARPNPDIERMLDACQGSGRPVIIVSNNAGPAINAYLERQGLADRIDRVIGRAPADPSSMKPSPRLLLRALGSAAASTCVFVGDSPRDVEAGHAAGVPTIGYANKPGKAERLAAAGAVAVVTSLDEITTGLTPVDATT